MKRHRFLLACILSVTVANLLWAQQAVFEKVKVRFNRSEEDRRLIDKKADLILDDSSQRLVVKSKHRPLDIAYEKVQKIVFDVSTHMRGGALGGIVGGVGLVGAVSGPLISAKHVSDYWCYIEYEAQDNSMRHQMLEIDKESSPKAIEKMQGIFGDRVVIAEFKEKGEKIDKKTLKDLQSKHKLKIDKENHPMPEIKPDKALLIVVCPPTAARKAGKGSQMKLHANDRVVAVNKQGTYCLVYLDPGEYLLVSQAGNANGFRMKLEAGKDYYFLQNVFSGAWKETTSLSRNTKELVMHELSGAWHADWERKK